MRFGPPVVNENSVGEEAAQRSLELMAMRVDEARHDDMPGRVDVYGAGRVDLGGDLGNPRPLEQHVADGVIADALVHRQDCPAPDQRTATLNANTLGHGGRCRAMDSFKVDRGGSPQVRRGCECCGEAAGTPAPASEAARSQNRHTASSLALRSPWLRRAYCPRFPRTANREPDRFLCGSLCGSEKRARLGDALVLFGGGRGIIDNAGPRLDMHEPVFHH